ncbi:MAG: hypothetical protein ACRDQ1_19280, partial [Sciscionella sp.]
MDVDLTTPTPPWSRLVAGVLAQGFGADPSPGLVESWTFAAARLSCLSPHRESERRPVGLARGSGGAYPAQGNPLPLPFQMSGGRSFGSHAIRDRAGVEPEISRLSCSLAQLGSEDDVNGRHALLVLLAPVFALSAGCAVTPADHSHSTPMSPGMTMPGTTMPGMTMSGMRMSGMTSMDRPSAAAAMICGSETRHHVASLLGLSSPPSPTDSWTHQIYTCTYRVSGGRLVLSVHDSSAAAGSGYFNALRHRLGHTQSL